MRGRRSRARRRRRRAAAAAARAGRPIGRQLDGQRHAARRRGRGRRPRPPGRRRCTVSIAPGSASPPCGAPMFSSSQRTPAASIARRHLGGPVEVGDDQARDHVSIAVRPRTRRPPPASRPTRSNGTSTRPERLRSDAPRRRAGRRPAPRLASSATYSAAASWARAAVRLVGRLRDDGGGARVDGGAQLGRGPRSPRRSRRSPGS